MGRDILDLLRRHAGPRVRPYATYSRGRERHFFGASAIVPGERAASVRDALRAVVPAGFQVLVGNDRFLELVLKAGPKGPEYVVPAWWGDDEWWAMKPFSDVAEVVVTGGRPNDVLRLARSPSVNLAPTPLETWRRVGDWDARFGVDVLSANDDGFSLRFLRPPADPRELAAEIVAFCKWAHPAEQANRGRGPIDLSAAIHAGEEIVLRWED